ncbi:hypothetical protein [Phenylobacterium sp.]|uniref:hypothetical protein n=1 Tax=Phenylobacterium sp. TaxID=1871053 RepID=UPI00286DCCC4|nr:hypothetical protein [Phenylobacterium sp.]
MEDRLSSASVTALQLAKLRGLHLLGALAFAAMAFWLLERSFASAASGFLVGDLLLLVVTLPVVLLRSWLTAVLHLLLSLAWVAVLFQCVGYLAHFLPILRTTH